MEYVLHKSQIILPYGFEFGICKASSIHQSHSNYCESWQFSRRPSSKNLFMKVCALNHQNLYLALVHVTEFGTDFFILIFFQKILCTSCQRSVPWIGFRNFWNIQNSHKICAMNLHHRLSFNELTSIYWNKN